MQSHRHEDDRDLSWDLAETGACLLDPSWEDTFIVGKAVETVDLASPTVCARGDGGAGAAGVREEPWLGEGVGWVGGVGEGEKGREGESLP